MYEKKTSQGDFRLMSFTAGRCSTPLIVCVSKSRPVRKPIATNPDRRTSEASPPVSDRKPPAAELSEAAGVGPKGLYEPNRTDRSVLF